MSVETRERRLRHYWRSPRHKHIMLFILVLRFLYDVSIGGEARESAHASARGGGGATCFFQRGGASLRVHKQRK